MELKNRYTRVQFAIVFGAIYLAGAMIVTSQAWKNTDLRSVFCLSLTYIFIALTIRALQLRLRDTYDRKAILKPLIVYVMSAILLSLIGSLGGSVLPIWFLEDLGHLALALLFLPLAGLMLAGFFLPSNEAPQSSRSLGSIAASEGQH